MRFPGMSSWRRPFWASTMSWRLSPPPTSRGRWPARTQTDLSWALSTWPVLEGTWEMVDCWWCCCDINGQMSRIVKKLEEEKTRNMRTTMEAVEKLDRFLLHTSMRFTHWGQTFNRWNVKHFPLLASMNDCNWTWVRSTSSWVKILDMDLPRLPSCTRLFFKYFGHRLSISSHQCSRFMGWFPFTGDRAFGRDQKGEHWEVCEHPEVQILIIVNTLRCRFWQWNNLWRSIPGMNFTSCGTIAFTARSRGTDSGWFRCIYTGRCFNWCQIT